MGNEAPLGTHNLWNTEGVELPGPLRALVRELRKHAVENPYGAAVNNMKRWAAKGNAKWVRVLAQWEAARAKAKATPNTKTAHEDAAALKLADHGPYRYKHGWIPIAGADTTDDHKRHANTLAGKDHTGAKAHAKTLTDEQLRGVDGEMTRRAAALGKAGQVSKQHRAVKDEIVRRGGAEKTTTKKTLKRVAASHLSLASDSSGGKHDLVWFTKRSTPLVVKHGEQRDYPDSYGSVTKRRPATAAEEKQIAGGRWVRVDDQDRKPSNSDYKKTRLRPALTAAQEADMTSPCPTCGVHVTETEGGGLALAMPAGLAKANAAKKTGADSSTSGPSTTKNASTKTSSVTVPPAWRSQFDQLVSKMMAKKSPGTTREQVEKAALALLKQRNGGTTTGVKKAA